VKPQVVNGIGIERVIDVRSTKFRLGLEGLFLAENEFGLLKPPQI
jgi:hypothetical protein